MDASYSGVQYPDTEDRHVWILYKKSRLVVLGALLMFYTIEVVPGISSSISSD